MTNRGPDYVGFLWAMVLLLLVCLFVMCSGHGDYLRPSWSLSNELDACRAELAKGRR